MIIQMKSYLQEAATQQGLPTGQMQFPDCTVETDRITVLMINEVPPKHPEDFLYSQSGKPEDMQTILPLFRDADLAVNSIQDILDLGIYITTALKSPKAQSLVDNETIEGHLPFLEKEIALFPRLQAVMLMGDVAKKAFNKIVKKETKRNCIPTGSTYKLRHNEYYYKNIRVFPSYIMTGGNLRIERGKMGMISEDIRAMADTVGL